MNQPSSAKPEADSKSNNGTFQLKKNQPHSETSFLLKLATGYYEEISFVAANIPHIVWRQNPKSSPLPTIMVDETVPTGGDLTVATGGIDQKRVTPFVELNQPIKFTVDKISSGFLLTTQQLILKVDATSGTIAFYRPQATKPLLIQQPPVVEKNQIKTHLLVSCAFAQYYGGGMQNGRYQHTGHRLKIENLNDWVAKGISSPAPFVWSTAGFGVVNNTYTKGIYDLQDPQEISFSYQDPQADTYYLFGKKPAEIMQAYFALTGKPLVLPKFAFYPAHLNAYNRDTWVQVTPASAGARLFEDGKYYREYQPVNPKSFNDKAKKTIEIAGKPFVPAVPTKGRVTFVKDQQGHLITKRESLNGELNNYQFSARQIIERYQQNDVPLGWFVPNDGYGAGYGQTASLTKNLANLRAFADFAAQKGVKTGLWTQENLHPKDPTHPQADERDFQKEVQEAHVAAIKTDVAWVGSGYQAGIGAIKDAAYYMKKYGNNERPLALTVDGWAGTQKYAAVWTGDQKGGNWENIAFQIPTYLSSALSGLANVGSDIDGIYGGGDPIIQTRDLQWKSFTPIQLFMDGWGSENKTPFSFGERFTAINRFYLKLKSQLLPYFYSAAYRNRLEGLPLLQPVTEKEMVVILPTADLDHEFLLGSEILVAPIYQNTEMTASGADIRNGIYLPDAQATWIDFFTGKAYAGGQVLNKFPVPLWKTPVFVKQGAIIAENKANNHPGAIDSRWQIITVYPSQHCTQTVIYDDDGYSEAYHEQNEYVKTPVMVKAEASQLFITIGKTQGSFSGFVSQKQTIIKVKTAQAPQNVFVNGQALPAAAWHFSSHHQLKTFTTIPELRQLTNGGQLTLNLAKHNVKTTSLLVEIQF